MKRLVPILLLLVLSACVQKSDLAFMANGDVRLEINGKAVFTYDENICQLSMNRGRCEFCAFTDNTSDYFIIKLSSIPSKEGEYVTGDLTWTTSSSVETRKEVAFKLIKLEGDKLWLSESGGSAAVCIRLI